MAIARANGGTGRDVSSSTWTLTFGFTATAGNLLVIVATSSPNPMTTPSGYTLAVSKATVPNTYIWYKIAAGGETSAGMAVTGGSSYSIAHVIEFSGVASSSPLDKTASGGGSSDSTAQSGTTSALAQADEVVVVGYGLDDQVFSFTQASGFTSNALTRDTFDVKTLQSSYKIVSATTAVTADGTWPMSAVDSNVLATFKAAGAAGVTGTAAGTFGSFTGSASGAHGVAGTASGSFGAFSGSATGTHGVTGTAAATFASFVGAASGSFGVDITGTAAAVFPAFSGSATGTVLVTGAATAAFPQFVGAASGLVPSPWRPKVVFVT